MAPIINPWLFYWIHIVSNLIGLMACIAIIFGFAAIFSWIGLAMGDSACNKKIAKKMSLIAIVALLIGSFIPTRETMYTMIAASMVTPDNISIVGDSAEEIVDYIVESVDKLLEEDKQSA